MQRIGRYRLIIFVSLKQKLNSHKHFSRGMPIKGMPLLLFCTIIIKNTTTMTVKEIFDHPAVKAVEIEILDTIRDEERCRKGEDAKLAVQHLLSVRKRILNGMFKWTDEYYSLLSEFNKALVDAQCKMRERLFKLSKNVKVTCIGT